MPKVTGSTPPNELKHALPAGVQIWFGAIVAVIPFAIGAYEFGKRIVSRPLRLSPWDLSSRILLTSDL